MAANFKSIWNGCKAVVPVTGLRRKEGSIINSIINIASLAEIWKQQ